MDNSQTLPLGSAAAPAKEKTTASRLKSIFSGSVGNMVEWYDWYVYAAFSLYFAKVFFPKGDTTAQLLNTAAIFAVGFLMRPIGGWLMGLYADRKGRKAALMASVLLMCFGSLIIALTPGYETIGVGAPILLVLARLMQGLSVGGEYGTSATYLSEMATKERRGFFSSFQYVTLISGQLIALAVLIVLQNVLTTEELQSWGWRIPFGIGALCAIVALYLRRGMEETESFTKKKEKPKESLMRTLMRHPKELMTVVGLTMGGTLAFYTYTTYMQKYLVNTVGMSISDSTTISAATLFLFMCLQPVVGALSDKIGRRPILIAFGILGTLFTVPILTTLHTIQSWWGAFFLIMAALIIVSGYTSINAVVKAELFPTEIRALGVGLPYALTVSIFGGTAEYIALWFKSVGMETGYYWYVTACIAVSLLVYITMKDTRKHSRIETD
ncbi:MULTISPECIES: MFS transporter [Pseudomonas]|jgi:MFS transporter, MHS family, alpha-ketoglutarate permease|uniref:MFS transporter n=1 Tax=Pseudomonas chlororaphis TaxID=587753 RepID=A0AB34C172_9PSED|nr:MULTISPECIES: MFS transporter [Pseudomonas]AMS16409.1 MFS transporter [Pseudomonas chlororaphis]AZD17631.1 Dicarboxylate MFS transporter [Pseudomonas chlororaphis]EJK99844.1 alpha-ketoglutarate MFS transporter KgtP [Pseudomonas chlororaphis subsp. aureofaciens 30-84]KAA5839880.1 MFS transporter [Pseudomonas chlororaphis]MCP1483145.1 MHS family alpha-ketoglutarate permease-like MFS transporter [Pseudomonas chlororaphis]